LDEVLERKKNPQLLIFKTLFSDEKLVDLERRMSAEKVEKEAEET
jgi:hypothetical protein